MNGERGPATFELCRYVLGQGSGERARSFSVFCKVRQKASAHQHLEAVADAQDRASLVDEALELRAEMHREILRQERASAQVVAVGETAWDDQKMIVQ